MFGLSRGHAPIQPRHESTVHVISILNPSRSHELYIHEALPLLS